MNQPNEITERDALSSDTTDAANRTNRNPEGEPSGRLLTADIASGGQREPAETSDRDTQTLLPQESLGALKERWT